MRENPIDIRLIKFRLIKVDIYLKDIVIGYLH